MKQQYNILCVDDDPEISRVYKRLLERRGHIVRCCSNGKEALEAVDQACPDLILMDSKMPVMDGMTASEKLRRRPDTLHVPILFVSGYTNEEDILYCLAMGGTDFICKPFEPGELMAKVSFALRRYYESTDYDGGLPMGTRVAGRYEIISHLDSGGFSQVYKALDVTSGNRNNPYALKIFDFPYAQHSNRHFLYTILREAYQLCKLDHPCIIKVLDFGQFGNFIFIVMEYVHGEALDRIVSRNGCLSEANAAFIGYEVAGVLQYLDTKDIIHRDIKPDNMMIDHEGEVKLIDFGLAKQRREQTLSIKRDEFRGTAQFVSPEYIDGKEVDIESDIYALGATLYYISTGIKPFDGEDLTEILKRQLMEIPPPIKDVRPELSQELSDLVAAMLKKDPAERPDIMDIRLCLGDILSASEHAGEGGLDLKTAVEDES